MSASFALLAAIVFLTSGHGCAFPMRWCVLSDKEQAKCMDFQAAIGILANKLKMQVQFSCVIGSTPKDCMMKIKSGSADLITLDGGHIQTAGKDHDLVPVVGEDYYNLPGLDGVSYKAVAVAKKSNRDVTFQKLKGKKSCHTGADKTAGWNVPVGTLLRMGIMQQDKSCNAYVSAGKFFDKSCVPNVRDKDPNAANLCALCPTECDNTQGIYYGYSGAFKCMNAGLGDVAFIKHTTLKENNANPDEYVYLCKDGRREASWENCYLANVPAHAVMTKSSHDHNSNFRHLLVKASEDYGVNQTNSNMFQLFNSSKYDGSDLLFKDSTKRLVAIGERNSYQRWLGEDYLKDLEVLVSCPGTPTPKDPVKTKKATFIPTTSKKGKRNKPHLFIALVSFVAMMIAVFF